MNEQNHRPRKKSIMAGLEVTGDVLLLQILFLLGSLPILTMLPAAIALQRTFRKTILEDRPGAARIYVAEFKWAFSRLGLPGLLLPISIAAASFSILFWLSTPGIPGSVALCFIIPLCGAGVGAYIALLGSVMNADDDTPTRRLLDGAFELALNKPLPLAGCVIVLATWAMLSLTVPTLIPLGSGLVPALLAWFMVRSRLNAGGTVSG